jgi:hypothetical protein
MLLIALVKAGVMQHNDKEAHIYYLNPPKGTTNNYKWAVNASDYLLELGFPAIPIRPGGEPSVLIHNNLTHSSTTERG